MDPDFMSERTRTRFQLSGTIDPERQRRAEAVLGMMSYRLLASRAYRLRDLRTYTIAVLVDQLEKCLDDDGGSSATRRQWLVWAIESHLFMHVEDLASLLRATERFGTEWEARGRVEGDRIATDYLRFGSNGDAPEGRAASGANPVSALRRVANSSCAMHRAMWMPRKKEFGCLYPGVPGEPWYALKGTVDRGRAVAKEIVASLESEVGRQWYAMYLRYKHGAPLLAFDLFALDITLLHPDGLSPEENVAAREEVKRQLSQVHVLLPQHPSADARKQVPGPVAWSLDGSPETARRALGSSQVVSELEFLVCGNIVHRAETPGAREFLVVRPRE